MNFNTVIFDRDGLLIDSEKMSLQIYQTVLTEFGHNDFTQAIYTNQYSGHTEEDNVANLLSSYQLPFTHQELLDKVHGVEADLVSQGIDLKRGVKDLLAYLKNKRITVGLATSSLADRALTILNQHEITDYFDQMTFGAEVARSKPAPDIFLRVCEKLGCRPQESLVLEDSEAGILAARAAGATVICVPDMKEPSAEILSQTLAVLPSLTDVKAYLETYLI